MRTQKAQGLQPPGFGREILYTQQGAAKDLGIQRKGAKARRRKGGDSVLFSFASSRLCVFALNSS